MLLEETCSGQPLEQVAVIPQDLIFRVFGKDLSMGKGQGLIGMLELVQHRCRERIVQRRMRAEGLS